MLGTFSIRGNRLKKILFRDKGNEHLLWCEHLGAKVRVVQSFLAHSDPGSPLKQPSYGSSCCASCVGRKVCWSLSSLSSLRWGVLKPWDTKKLLVSCKLDQIGIFWWGNRWFWGTGTSILRNIQSLKIIGMFINIWLWVKKSGTLLNTDCYGCPSHHSYEIIMYHR